MQVFCNFFFKSVIVDCTFGAIFECINHLDMFTTITTEWKTALITVDIVFTAQVKFISRGRLSYSWPTRLAISIVFIRGWDPRLLKKTSNKNINFIVANEQYLFPEDFRQYQYVNACI